MSACRLPAYTGSAQYMRDWSRRDFLIFTAAWLPACAGTPGGSRRYPAQPIVYVCQGSAGGSSDRFVRGVVSHLQSEQIFSVPVTVEYRAGGGGAVAANYVSGRAANPYFLLNASGNFIAAPLRDRSVPGYAAFTAIARLAFDLNSIVVRADSPYRTIGDLIDVARTGKGLTWAGTSVGSQDHLTVLALQRQAGVAFPFISFTGSGEVVAALLGGHTDIAAMEPIVAKPHVEAGRARILAVVSEHRVATLPDVPTLKEQGYDITLNMQRGVVAPSGIPEEARTHLVGGFERLAATPAWKEYLAREGLLPAYLGGEQYVEFLEMESAKWAGELREANLLT